MASAEKPTLKSDMTTVFTRRTRIGPDTEIPAMSLTDKAANFSLDDIALHFLSLYFIRLSTNKVLTHVEDAFAAHYVQVQRTNHIRGMLVMILFFVVVIYYDYLALYKTNASAGSTMNSTSLETCRVNIIGVGGGVTAFKITMLLRFGLIVPLLVVNIWAVHHTSSKTYLRVTYVSHWCLGVYFVVYNKITCDFGVTWLCLVIMYFYSCTPVRFLYIMTASAVLLLIYPAVIFPQCPSDATQTIIREYLYALGFFVLISFPSQSREFAIRVSYMSETLLLSQQHQLEQEETRSKLLLGSMLPASVIAQLQSGRELIADAYPAVTVLFCEVCHFDDISGQLAPAQVVELLNTIFSKFDLLVDSHSVHKIETIGAVYMVAGGCPDLTINHTKLVANLALEMISAIPELQRKIRKTFTWAANVEDINIRIGINAGSLMAGVVGIRNPRFKLFGDTVNVASRMESTNLPGHIQMTEWTAEALKDEYEMELRGTIPVKGRGEMQTYFLQGRKEGTPIIMAPIRLPAQPLTNSQSVVLPPRQTGKMSMVRSNIVQEVLPSQGMQARDAIMKLIPSTGETSVRMRSSTRRHNVSSSLQREPMLQEENGDEEIMPTVQEGDTTSIVEVVPLPSALMGLPEGLTKRNLVLSIHATHSFEKLYRYENDKGWLRFLRYSIFLGGVMKVLVMTMYQTLSLLQVRDFNNAQFLFYVNICVTLPVVALSLLFTFVPKFDQVKQIATFLMMIFMSMVLNIEAVATGGKGHIYYSVFAMYQCHFSILSFSLRLVVGLYIFAMYLITFMVIIDPPDKFQPTIDATGKLTTWWDASGIVYARNALYIFVFLGANTWVVFNMEYKQRINHFRDLVLNAQQQKLLEEQDRVSKLLLNLLPETIVLQLKTAPEKTIAESFDNVTILFTDMVNFTSYSSRVTAMELVQFLNDMYTRFDTITERRALYKVEIIGDAYFVVGGCPLVTNVDALTVLQAGMDMLATLPVLRRNSGNPNLNIRIGVHSGPVVAGVVGIKDPRYHLFGDTVAIAQHLESTGSPGRIHLSESTYSRVKSTDPNAFKFEYHKMLTLAGHHSKLRTYFVTT
ncbi:Nitrogen permease regulator 2 [Aphanomyces cochlioides]|nr:Nitrogen permease regulator 2 [Aphanomyces cochlioides]